jgi:hypothetical protein
LCEQPWGIIITGTKTARELERIFRLKTPGKNRKRLHRTYIGLVILLAYAGLACINTWPLAAQMTTHLPGKSDDEFVHYWNSWWVQQALSSGQSPLHTHLLFYPQGVSLVTHNLAWSHILPWLPLEPLFGGITAYNLALLLNLTACGCAVFLLTKALTNDSRPAFLAGLIYQAWPFRLTQIDHPNLLATQWIPVFFLFLIYTTRRGRWRHAVLTGLFFALAGYTRWQQLIPAALMALIYLACTVSQWLSNDKRRILVHLVVAGCVASAMLAPPILLLLGQTKGEDGGVDLMREGEETVMQTDVLAYVTPGQSHPVLGEHTRPLYDRYYADRASHRRFTAYIGLVASALVLTGVLSKRRAVLPWVLMTIVLALLALGPLVRFNGQFYPNTPTLYGFLSPIGIIRLMRVPDRFNVFLALPVSVLAGYGARTLLASKGVRTRFATAGVATLLGGLILFEYLAIPAPLQRIAAPSSFYSDLAEEEGDFAVLNLPFEPLKAKIFMFSQTSHGRPILQGKIARIPDGAYAYIDANPWLSALHQTNEMPPELSDVSRQLARLAQDDIRYIVVHKQAVGGDRVAHWRRYLLIEPSYEDEIIAAYATLPVAGRDFELVGELAPGIGSIDTLVSADCLNPGRILEVDVGWGSSSPPGQDLDATIWLVDDIGVAQQRERFPVSTVWPTSQWSRDTVAWGYYAFTISSSLPAGEYTVTLSLLDSETGDSRGGPVAIRSVVIQPQICDLALESEATDVNALFGDDLHLSEYELRRNGRYLEIALYWRSQRRMDIDYKVFVHVFDPATNVPVAQDDAMPRRWAYPTTLWWPGETVKDRIPIFLEGAPSGSYGIAIGVYDPSTGDRLPVVDSEGQSTPDGRLVLSEIVEIE